MSSYRSLLDKFERTKRELGDAENTIRRLTGRDPDEIIGVTPGSGKYRFSSSASVSSRPSFSSKKKLSYVASKRPRERASSYEEESSSNDESPSKKPVLQSTVVAKRHQKRSRKATIEELNANSKIKARNRRMFGALIGTLEKFQHEEKKRQHKVSMRAEIEQKVEAATEEEKERIKREKELCFVRRREILACLRCLEKKIERAQSHAAFESNHRKLLNFIMTKSKPSIFFLPSSHTPETKKSLEQSRFRVQELMKKQKESYEADILEIEELYRKDYSVPGDKENKHLVEESESQGVPAGELESIVNEQEEANYDLNLNPNPNPDPNPNPNSNSNSDFDSNPEDEIESNNVKNVRSLVDQDFEPIYD